MLEEMTPRQYNEWRAAFDVEPSINGWEQAGTITAHISNAIRAIAGMFTKKSDYKPVEPKHFIPHIDFAKQKRDDGIEQAHAIIKSKFGVE